MTGLVIITGGLGLIGQRLLRSILSVSSSNRRATRVVLIDTSESAQTDPSIPFDQNAQVSVIRKDMGDTGLAARLKSAAAASTKCEPLSVFHLASVMSAQGEKEFDHALRVNIDGTRSLLETCRDIGSRPRFLFVSSIAAFGGGAIASDTQKHLPQSTYGMTKACAELLVNDATRRGYIDGRIARLPTVIVRPGPPNPASTGCFSSVPKAVLQGQDFVAPISPGIKHPCIGLASAVRGILSLHDVPEAKMAGCDRAVTLPSVSLTLHDLEQSARKLTRDLGRQPGKVTYKPDTTTEMLVRAMPSAVDMSRRARDLGLISDPGADQIIKEYIEDQHLG